MKCKKFLLAVVCIVAVGSLIPQHLQIPVAGADKKSYNKASFWYFPWGRSVTHKGVDVFAKEGTDVVAATSGLVLYRGQLGMGGNVLLILGPQWRLHYYAHLQQADISIGAWVTGGERIGSVGSTGNAKGKPPHLHYSIVTMVPYPWRMDSDRQGWKKMFYLNPISYF